MSNYKNLEFIPTWKIKEILDSPHCTGIDGADYEPVKEYLEAILWSRDEKRDLLALREFNKREKEFDKFNAV